MAGGGVVNDQTDQTDQFKSEEWTYVHAPSWLRREVAEQVAIGGIFHVAVAAGLACSDRPNGPARAWVDGLTDDDLDALEAYAEVEAGRLWQRLEPVVERTAPHDPAWVEALAEVLRSRDNLSRVYSVLDERERGTELGAALSVFDRMARPMLDVPPRVVHDPRLKGASSNPEKWWAQPAREGSEA